MGTNEAFSRVRIDAQLADQGWNTQDTNCVRYEVMLEDGTRADYVLCDRHGRSLAVIEAKRFSINPADAAEQAKNYAKQLNVPYIFLANGQEIRFWEWQREAYPRPVKTFFKQDDLERRAATAQVKRNLLEVPIDTRIAGRHYQAACIDILCTEIGHGRRKLLVEMATGTDKTRTAAALRVLFLGIASRSPSRPRMPLPSTCPTTPPMCYALAAAFRTRSSSPSPRCKAW